MSCKRALTRTDEIFGKRKAQGRAAYGRCRGYRALVRALRAGDSASAEQLVIDEVRGGLDDLRREPGDLDSRAQT